MSLIGEKVAYYDQDLSSEAVAVASTSPKAEWVLRDGYHAASRLKHDKRFAECGLNAQCGCDPVLGKRSETISSVPA